MGKRMLLTMRINDGTPERRDSLFRLQESDRRRRAGFDVRG